MNLSRHSREQLVAIYQQATTIAVVGASADPANAAHQIPAYLADQGYRVLPVNPRGGELFGHAVHTSLADIDDSIDVVDVFRPATEAATIARQAVASGASVLWFQPGTVTDEAVQIASNAGLNVVTGRCMGAMHAALGLPLRTP